MMSSLPTPRASFIWSIGLGLTLFTSSHAAEFVWVEPGREPAPIVLFPDAPPRTRDAAVELAEYVEKISGRKPRIVDGAPPSLPGRAVWVGVQPALKTLLPGVDLEFTKPEETLLVVTQNHLVVAGRDRWDPERLDVETKDGTLRGKQLEYGTVNAVYSLLQDQLGVRWFWPGELGEDVVRQARVAIPEQTRRYAPQIRGRCGILHYSDLGEVGYGRSKDWTLRQRLQYDSYDLGGGHGFGTWWDRYHEKYPEIFALQPDATRSGFPQPHNAKLCMSNPKVGELWLDDVAATLALDPNQTLFNASPNDGWASGHCVCEKCRAWDHPDGEPREFNWLHRREVHPAASDRDVTFANKLGELLEARYPGRGYRVVMMSYGHSRPVPVAARPSQQVIMSIVANFFGRTGLVDRGSTRGDTYRKQFEAWAKIVPAMIWRPNTGSPAGWQQGLPDLSTQQTIRDLQDVAAANCEGIFIDSTWEHWATQGPQYYVMAQLTWNPKVDAAAVLDDYYRRAFGSAAEPVREYFNKLEAARMAFTAEDGESGVFAFPTLYTDELLGASQTRLDRAAAAVPVDSVHARRVAFVQTGLDYTRLTLDDIRLMEGYWKTKDEAVAAKVKKNWEAIERLVAANPHSINWGPVRPQTPRMAGLHPDYPAKKVKKARAVELDLK